ncbi:uncharacterized protein BXZ73DRAFT_32291, partial [Epithele typhae]|uniref:uncharacterized protein n=1 Tax=Epithele typhae TaxID=378194 RepID=UPI002008A1C8
LISTLIDQRPNMAASAADPLPFPNFSDVVLPSDRARLAGLSPTAVQAWTASRAAEYRRLALGLFSIYNAVTPINRALPTEMLSEIFAHCWQEDNSRSIRVTHVCRLWRAIAHKTPRFWAAAASAPGPMLDFEGWDDWPSETRETRLACLTTVLARTKPEPVIVAVRGFQSPIPSVLLPCASRLAALHVTLTGLDQISALRDLL